MLCPSLLAAPAWPAPPGARAHHTPSEGFQRGVRYLTAGGGRWREGAGPVAAGSARLGSAPAAPAFHPRSHTVELYSAGAGAGATGRSRMACALGCPDACYEPCAVVMVPRRSGAGRLAHCPRGGMLCPGRLGRGIDDYVRAGPAAWQWGGSFCLRAHDLRCTHASARSLSFSGQGGEGACYAPIRKSATFRPHANVFAAWQGGEGAVAASKLQRVYVCSARDTLRHAWHPLSLPLSSPGLSACASPPLRVLQHRSYSSPACA